ncbi:type IV pilus modification PilV family protein [Bacillus ectoiniformans]|uniref:type IV pilus modification PilV family protein n=1 Tax=Bacillus ectoiniformans TaxID=1494429 RepID=UPI00195DC214|nr:prepilin-type N-terminal cleavage/methylation domain-containing protein [Bacillus ectoiniformans]
MNLLKYVRNSEKGVTLLELLLAMTILSIVLLTFTRFFYQAGTFNHTNQNKTVALNVARNAMMYMEKQPFIKVRTDMEEALLDESKRAEYSYKLMICNDSYQYFLPSASSGPNCELITINSEDYQVTVYPEKMEDPTKRKYYIPVTVEVRWEADGNPKTTTLAGTIKSEDLR